MIDLKSSPAHEENKQTKSSQKPTLSRKVVIIGSQGVGKTSLLSRFAQNSFSKNTTATVGAREAFHTVYLE